ncbi:MAG: T9SS type A sorting domain-containing protein [Salinivirgaceae bacterium]|nr:T9SS type A sorting domain-containing protein [Salinivirgaceae bacterium]MDY0281175.1 T9SS type A sorting domain-containing protein [Salinivirgaceae bacterium]
MKLKTLAILISATSIVFGQTPYTADDFITNGSMFIYQNSQFIDQPQPLSTFTTDGWNFQWPTNFENDTVFTESVANLNMEAQFPDADFCLAQTGAFAVLKLNENKLWILGIIASFNDYSFPVILSESIDIMHFPLLVGNSIVRERSIPITLTPAQLGITAADLGIPIEPDSIRITVQININSAIQAHNIFNNREAAFMESNTQTIAYAVEVLYWNIWWPISSVGGEQTTKATNYWIPGYGLPVCTIAFNPDEMVVGFKIAPDFTTSIPDFVQNVLTIYPNPTHGILKIKNSNSSRIDLFDLAGQHLLSTPKHNNEIDLRPFPAGTYILKQGNKIQKVIKY